MAECIYTHEVNQSMLISGFIVPVEKYDVFASSLGASLARGEKIDIVIWLDGKKYSGTYNNVGFSDPNADTKYKICYSNKDGLLSALRNIFSPDSDNYDEAKGRLEVYSEKTGELEFKCFPESVIHTSNVDKESSAISNGFSLKSSFDKILNEYVLAKRETFGGHKMGTFFRNEIPQTIYGTGIVSPATHLITGSVGQGNWANIPWICIFDKNITTTATKGVYIVYLLSKDGNSLYLTLNQGCTEIKKEAKSNKETIQILHKTADNIRNKIDHKGFIANNNINLGDNLTDLGMFYQEGTVFYKEYKKGSVPEESELREDLQNMMDIYRDYVSGNNETEWWPTKSEYDPYISKQRWIKILSDNRYVTKNLLNVLACYYDIGGESTILQMVAKYGETENFYRMTCINLAKKLVDNNICPEPKFGDNSKYWPVLFLGRRTKNIETGDYVWKLRPELKAALEEIDILKYLVLKGGEEKLSTKETLEKIKNYISAKGFTFEEGLVENFYLSLKSKPFVILAGTSGTGKTRLVRLFAEAIGANSKNGRYKLVSVRPDWSDSSDLFGHVNLNDKFIPGPIIDFIKKAELDDTNPYFLCLDEMNLARVEYYLSDILSIIETRECIDGKVITDPLIDANYYGGDLTARDNYGIVRIPENLYIIGTVNMDETTFPFSRKVLDRANTIEFSTVNLLANFEKTLEQALPTEVNNSFMKSDYVFFSQCDKEKDFVQQLCIELEEINKILNKANAHIGYRVRDEIVFYMLNNNKANLLDRNDAFDREIMQKILPRIQGSSVSIKSMLCELFKHCASDFEGYQTENDDASSKMLKAAQKDSCKYKASAKKIAFMVRRFEEDGFTSYWL